MVGIVEGSPCAAAMGVGAITDALCRLWSRLRVHEWPMRVRGGVCTSERNTSTLHFKVMRPIYIEFYVFLVMILDMLVHQESTEKPKKGPLSYPTAAQKSIRYRRTLLAFDAQEAGGRTLATASLQHIHGSLKPT